VDGESVSSVLARELLDLVSMHAPWLSLEVPGFAEAMSWSCIPADGLSARGVTGNLIDKVEETVDDVQASVRRIARA